MEPIQHLLKEAQALQKQKRYAEAIRTLAEVDRLEPGNPQARLVLGRIFRDQDQAENAIEIFQGLADEFPGQGEVLSELALVKLRAGKEDEAFALAKKALDLAPDSLLCLEYFGRVATGLKQWPAAISCFEKLAATAPGEVQYHKLLANAYNEARRFGEAVKTYRKVLELEPVTHEHARNMGRLLFWAQNFAEAIVWYRKALAGNSEELMTLFNLSRSLVQLGNMKEAEEMIYRAFELEQDFAPCLILLHEIRPDLDLSNSVKMIEQKLAADGPEKAEYHIRDHLFLGKYHHGKKHFDTAFAHFKAYNDLRFRAMEKYGVVYDKALMEENFRETKRIFNRDTLERLKSCGSNSEVPIFIIGMARSGTTLLEQILSSHPQVDGKGELGTLTWVFMNLNYLINEKPPRDIYDIIASGAATWSKVYLESLEARPDALRTTDKMPVNFIYLGIIQAIFPRARVIHIRRSPLDNCLSMFSNYFSESYAYTARLEDLGHYYNLYADLMAYWKKTLTMKFHEVQYEDLVNDPEAKVRQILDFCGLPWDPRVLEFHQGKKSAFTLSQVQVSRPINKASFGRWKPYEKHIQSLIKALDPAIVGPLDRTT